MLASAQTDDHFAICCAEKDNSWNNTTHLKYTRKGRRPYFTTSTVLKGRNLVSYQTDARRSFNLEFFARRKGSCIILKKPVLYL